MELLNYFVALSALFILTLFVVWIIISRLFFFLREESLGAFYVGTSVITEDM